MDFFIWILLDSFFFLFTHEKVMDRGSGGDLFVEYFKNLFGDRHFDSMPGSQLVNLPGRRNSLDFLTDFPQHPVQRIALAQADAKAPVSGLVVGAGQDDIAQAGKSHERFLPGSQCLTQAHQFGEPPGYNGCARIGAESEPVGGAGRNCENVFDRAPELYADDIVAGIDTKSLVVENLR